MGHGFSNKNVAFAGNGITQIFVNGTKQATTSGTTKDFTIPSGVKKFTVAFDQVSHSGTDEPGIQLGDSGGIEATGYHSGYAYVFTSTTQGTGADTTGFWVGNSSSAHSYTGILTGVLLDEATNTWAVTAQLWSDLTSAYVMWISGTKVMPSELTTVRVTCKAGATFDQGQVNIQYDNPDPTVVADSSSGKVVQTVNVQDGEYASTTTLAPQDDTILQNTEGGEFMTVSITPTNVANKLKIEVNTYLHNSAASWINYGIFQDSTADAIVSGEQYGTTGTGAYNVGLIYWMDAGTTSSTTFKFRAGQHIAGTFGMNGASTRRGGGVRYSSMTITEYKS